ncbi:MAG TPA: sensor domain-containing protein, partial [Solirubrobacteraceae bacterium]
MQQLALTIARRPITRDCWRETTYLVVSFITGLIGFIVIVTGVSVVAGLAILIIGIPLAVLLVHFDRWWCGSDRALAALVLGEPIPARYRPPRGATRVGRLVSALGDKQTWLDAVWMLISFPLGVAGFAIAVVSWSVVGALLTGPIWLWSIPNWIHRHDVWISILSPFLGVAAAIAAAWLVRAVALGIASLASWLLGPNRTEVLEERVETLAETRAGAVDAAHTELQRVERDLHDGAQARLVALAMDLGMAEQRLAKADPETAMEHVANARGQAQAAMAELRDLVRGIGPSILHDHGLDAALTALVTGRNPPVELRVELRASDVTARETAAYFVVAEALANARKHASATRISVRAWDDAADRLIVEVVDDGVGGADPDGGSGLAGLHKRVAALDGVLTVVSPGG